MTLPTSKALLLLQRERELYDLRRQRDRGEEWLRAMHALRPRDDLSVERCAANILDLLIDELGFEAAAVLQYPALGPVPAFRSAFPRLEGKTLALEDSARGYLIKNPSGLFEQQQPAALSSLFLELNLQQVLWHWSPGHAGSAFLMLAGRSERTVRMHALSMMDAKQFSMFSSHGGALLGSCLLMLHLDRERRELQETNRQLDNNVTELKRTQQQVLESSAMVARASRLAGMAEVATGVLHNVGNALNGVATCADVAERSALQLNVSNLQRLVDLLEGQDDIATFFAGDPRSKVVLPYLRDSAKSLERERGQVCDELSQLQDQVQHIRSVVSRQQQFARKNVVERTSLSGLMEDALILARSSRHDGRIGVVREFEPVDDLEIDKHRVLQILVNLMANALHSLTESQTTERVLTARIGLADEEVLLEIVDNGVGIGADDTPNIFRYGFTTRRHGHGFGLHTSKLTAKELGGDLTFSSPGKGRGATFRLSLPLHAQREALEPPSSGQALSGAPS